MVRIYKRDGTFTDYDESDVDVVTISADNIIKLQNYKNGVNIYFKNGTVKFINNAETDGECISITFNS